MKEAIFGVVVAIIVIGLFARKEPPVIKQKREVAIDRSHLPYREDLRIVKLDKGVFVIERRRFGKWEEVKTCKTRTKAEDWCACNSRTY